MGIFSNLTSSNLEQQQDHLGGATGPFPSDIYTATIKVAYAITSKNGAQGVSFVFDIDGREFRNTQYVTDRNQRNFFERDGKKSALPGFTLVDNICLLTTNAPLAEQDTEPKVVKIYNFTTRQDEPQQVPVLTGLVGKKIALALIHQKVNKNALNESTGQYEATAESREENAIDAVLHPELKLTVVEAMKGKTDPFYWDEWLKRNKGIVKDKRKKKADTPTGTTEPKRKLFG